MTVEIKHLSEKNEKKWDEFVKKTELATFCHQIKWKNIIENTYRLQNYFLFAENDNGDVVGVLPLFMVKDLFFGKRLISIPFVPYGGVCCETDAVGKELIDEAIAIGNKFNVDYCELRSIREQECTKNFIRANIFVTSILTLGNTPDSTLENMQRNKRKNVLKSERNDLHIKFFSEDPDIFPDFFDIYSQNSRRLGTPQHGEEFFKNILKYLPSDIVCVYKDNKYHYCALAIFFKDTVIDYISSSFMDSRKYFVTDFGV
jgi:lipid II:glycine glycyltransferase (peptidoglycan interpeptide bridge formation enzyme)